MISNGNGDLVCIEHANIVVETSGLICRSGNKSLELGTNPSRKKTNPTVTGCGRRPAEILNSKVLESSEFSGKRDRGRESALGVKKGRKIISMAGGWPNPGRLREGSGEAGG